MELLEVIDGWKWKEKDTIKNQNNKVFFLSKSFKEKRQLSVSAY